MAAVLEPSTWGQLSLISPFPRMDYEKSEWTVCGRGLRRQPSVFFAPMRATFLSIIGTDSVFLGKLVFQVNLNEKSFIFKQIND
jgi:hypothetical protein